MIYHIDWPFDTALGRMSVQADIEAETDEAMLQSLQASLPERIAHMVPWILRHAARKRAARLAALPLLDLLAGLAQNWNAQCDPLQRIGAEDLASPAAFVARAREIGTIR